MGRSRDVSHVLEIKNTLVVIIKMQSFSGLRARQDDARFTAAKNLKRFVATELREVSQELTGGFLEELNHTIYELVSSSEVHEKKGGILAIGKRLFKVD